VPAKQRVGHDDVKSLPPFGVETGEEDHEQALVVLEACRPSDAGR
jgi:hypothetical protein